MSAGTNPVEYPQRYHQPMHLLIILTSESVPQVKLIEVCVGPSWQVLWDQVEHALHQSKSRRQLHATTLLR